MDKKEEKLLIDNFAKKIIDSALSNENLINNENLIEEINETKCTNIRKVYNYLYEFMYIFDFNKYLYVKFDFENIMLDPRSFCNLNEKSLVGFRTIKIDNIIIPYLGVIAGGDWEVPVFFIIYEHDNELEALIPQNGNTYNTETLEAYGNNEKLDKDNCFNEYRHYDYREIKLDKNKILEEIEKHFKDLYIKKDGKDIQEEQKEEQKEELKKFIYGLIKNIEKIEKELSEIKKQVIKFI